MKAKFKTFVEGATPEIAISKVPQATGRSPKLVETSFDDVRGAVFKKLQRVQENYKLYGDKISEYNQILMDLDASDKRSSSLVDALLAHGDSRIDNPAYVGVIANGRSNWIVFGFTF